MKKTIKSLCATALLGLAALAPVQAAQFVLVNTDPAGAGFNDSTPAVPVGGNPGITVGQQRLIAYSRALQLWGSILKSDVPIVVLGSFSPRSCTPTSGVLASAGAWNVELDFPNAPLPGHWYHSALANSIAGADLYPGADVIDGADIVAFFNSELGTAGCLTTSKWYYGLDSQADAAAGEIDFLNVFPPEAIVNARVVVSPGHLKRMIRALNENLGRYEKQFGMIVDIDPGQVQGPTN